MTHGIFLEPLPCNGKGWSQKTGRRDSKWLKKDTFTRSSMVVRALRLECSTVYADLEYFNDLRERGRAMIPSA